MMQIGVGYELVYDCPQPTPMLLMLNVHYTRISDMVVPDHLMTSPSIPFSAYRDGFGNWCNRIVAPAGQTRLSANGIVKDTGERDVIASETVELARRERAYRGGRPLADPHGKIVILVDDGIATGASMLAAVRAVRAAGPQSIVVAVPVGPQSACRELAREADDVVCATMPPGFEAVGQVYGDFHQVSDDEVRELLATPTTDGALKGR